MPLQAGAMSLYSMFAGTQQSSERNDVEHQQSDDEIIVENYWDCSRDALLKTALILVIGLAFTAVLILVGVFLFEAHQTESHPSLSQRLSP